MGRAHRQSKDEAFGLFGDDLKKVYEVVSKIRKSYGHDTSDTHQYHTRIMNTTCLYSMNGGVVSGIQAWFEGK